MSELNKSIIKSLDGQDTGLLPYIPYLLQDLWEIGSAPEIINRLIKKHNCLNIKSKVLDLGCGKGAVAVNLAKEFECQVHGIDAMPEFIEEAKFWVDKYHQSHLCTFKVGDIRESINELRDFNLIVLGSIGPIFGNIENTLNSVTNCLTTDGFVVLDDGFIPDNSSFENRNYQKLQEAKEQITYSGFKLVDTIIIDTDLINESDMAIYENIEIRAKELIIKYPEKKNLFEAYLENQRVENDILENKVECLTWLLKKSN